MPGVLQPEAATGDVALKHEPPPTVEVPIEDYIVLNHEVSIEVDIRNKSIRGESRIDIVCLNEATLPDEIALDARQCIIDVAEVRLNGEPASVRYSDPYDALDIPESWDLTMSNHPVLVNRMKDLMPQRRRDLPITSRLNTGCIPVDGRLRISLRSTTGRPPYGSRWPS